MGFSPRISRRGRKRKKQYGKNPSLAAAKNGLTQGPELPVNEAKKKQREEIREMDKIRKARMREEVFGKGNGLKVSQPGEKHEVEADKMAEKVMGQTHYQSAQVENERLLEVHPFLSRMEDDKMSKAEEEPQAKLQAKEEEVSKAEEEPQAKLQAKEEEVSKAEEEPQAKLQAKEEEVSKAEEEPQAKLQAKEEEVSKAEEEPQAKLQAKEEEVSKAEEEPQAKLQAKEEEVSKAEEEPQAKLQAKEEEVSKAEEEPQAKLQAKEEEVSKAEEEPQAKLQAKEEEVSKAEEEPQAKLQAKEEEVSKADEEKMSPKTMGAKPKKPKKASQGFKHKLDQKVGTGAPLPAPLRAFMERKMGADFAGVRIHTDAQSMKMSKDIHAQAFTYKQDIFFNAGKYSPDSYEGKKLLAHELTHVIQQNDKSKKKNP